MPRQLCTSRSVGAEADGRGRAAGEERKLVTDGHTHQTLASRRGDRVSEDPDEPATQQADLRNEVIAVFKQVKRLADEKLLTPEQLARVEKAEALVRGSRLAADMNPTVDKLRAGYFLDASERMRRHAKELKDLAAA